MVMAVRMRCAGLPMARRSGGCERGRRRRNRDRGLGLARRRGIARSGDASTEGHQPVGVRCGRGRRSCWRTLDLARSLRIGPVSSRVSSQGDVRPVNTALGRLVDGADVAGEDQAIVHAAGHRIGE